MKTRSVKPSHVCAFSVNRYGGAGGNPFSGSATRIGPAAPRWSQTDAAPGPPLKTNVIGRSLSAASSSSERTYAMKNTLARGFSFASFNGMKPAVALYLNEVFGRY